MLCCPPCWHASGDHRAGPAAGETRGRPDAVESSTCPTVTVSDRKHVGDAVNFLLRNVECVSRAKQPTAPFMGHHKVPRAELST